MSTTATIHTQRFTPAAEIPANAVLVTWIDKRDGGHEHIFHRTQRAARAAQKVNRERTDVSGHGWKLIEKSDREHGIMVW